MKRPARPSPACIIHTYIQGASRGRASQPSIPALRTQRYALTVIQRPRRTSYTAAQQQQQQQKQQHTAVLPGSPPAQCDIHTITIQATSFHPPRCNPSSEPQWNPSTGECSTLITRQKTQKTSSIWGILQSSSNGRTGLVFLPAGRFPSMYTHGRDTTRYNTAGSMSDFPGFFLCACS